jgi:phage gp36-like protein
MPYITIAQLEVDYGAREILQLSDKENLKVRNDTRVQSAIDRAAAMMDVSLGKCYTLPLTMANGSTLDATTAMLLREWNGRLARFLLTDDARLGGTAEQAPHETRARYIETKKQLDALDPSKKGGCMLLRGVKLRDDTVDAAAGAPTVIFGDSGAVFQRSPADSSEYDERVFE